MPAILVMDDDSHALAATDAVLKRESFDALVARDGCAGLDLLRNLAITLRRGVLRRA